MIKTNCKRFNTAREYFEESIRICRSKEFWDAVGGNRLNDAQEIIEIALKRLEECGHVYIQGLGGIKENIGYGYLTYFSCEIDNTPRATKKEIAKLARLNELATIIRGRRDDAKTKEERKFYFRGMFRVSKLVHNLKKKYDWRDEMFRENGLVGLRNVNGDVLVPCGDYDFIHGCDYWDDTSFAIASRNGMYGLVKRDGKETVVTPFNYLNIDRWDYNTAAVYANQRYNIHVGHREADRIVSDLIVNGEVVVSSADWISEFERGGFEYLDREKNKYGFLGVYWDWILTEPIFDRIRVHDEQPYFTFVKKGEEGVLTTDKEFIPLEKWNSMTDDEQDEQWENIIGCLLLDVTSPIAID
jgi:hypothetical protein